MLHFDELLQQLLQKIVLMGATAESMIGTAVRGLIERNKPLFDEVWSKEEDVNSLQVQIDNEAVKLAATHQPVAKDVRFLFVASRVATDLERIADQAKNICGNAEYALEHPPLRPMVDLPIMAEIAQKMVRDSLTAMINKDVNLAEQVLRDEQKVDAFRDQIFRTLLTYMMADPGTIQRALSLLLISRNVERIGDHATNIAEEVIYLVQARDVRHQHLGDVATTAAATTSGDKH